MKSKTIIIFLIMFALILPSFGFAQNQQAIAPESLEEAKEIGESITKKAVKNLPQILKNIWKKEVLPIWQKMWNWVEPFWQKIKSLFGEEIEKRKPIIEEEFKKEKEEMKEDFPGVSKTLWERFNELIE